MGEKRGMKYAGGHADETARWKQEEVFIQNLVDTHAPHFFLLGVADEERSTHDRSAHVALAYQHAHRLVFERRPQPRLGQTAPRQKIGAVKLVSTQH
jgi:hypothetical protein